MAKIEVDYSYFNEAISSLEAYTKHQENKMNHLNQEIQLLNNDWKGADYDAYKVAFDNLKQDKSATQAFQKSLESYANILKATANEYKKAQQKALDLANKI